jgi:acyl carrier protein
MSNDLYAQNVSTSVINASEDFNNMSREELLTRVIRILVEQLGVEDEEITEEASFEEVLDADSLDLVELMMEVEDTFHLKMTDEDATRIQTVGDLIDWLARQQHLRTPRR